MKATVWTGKNSVEVQDVPDPRILDPKDAIIDVTSAAICGSDLHLLNGFVPTMQKGDILGHEFMGGVVEVGPEVKNLKVGDRVVVPFPIACGRAGVHAWPDRRSARTPTPTRWMAEKMYGHSTAGIYGYSHLTGGYPGGQAEYARVPFADVSPFKVPDELPDEKVLFLGRHPPDRLHGRGDVRYPAGRRRRGMGCRAGRPVRDHERLAARRRAGHRDRPVRLPTDHGPRERR